MKLLVDYLVATARIYNILANISLNDSSDQPTINLNDGQGSPTLSADQALDRATRAHLGLRDTLPDLSFEDVHKAISTGAEPQLRTRAAAAVDDRNSCVARPLRHTKCFSTCPARKVDQGTEKLSSAARLRLQSRNM